MIFSVTERITLSLRGKGIHLKGAGLHFLQLRYRQHSVDTQALAVRRQQIYLRTKGFYVGKAEAMKLFSDKGNYALLKVLSASNVAKKKLEVEYIQPETSSGPKFLQKVQLPYLELDGGQQLFNPNAICCYLLESTNEELLCKPSDRPKIDELLEWDVAALQPVALPYVMALSCGSKTNSQLLDALHQRLAVLNTLIEPGKNCVATTTTIADIVLWGSLFGVLHNNADFEDTEQRYPAVYRWFQHLSSQEEFKAAYNVVIGNQNATAFKDSFHAVSLPPNLFKLVGGSSKTQAASPDNAVEEAQEGPSPAELSKAKEAWGKGRSLLSKKKERKHPILPIPNERNILITSALPYVNNVPHLGNIIGCVLSADVYARYCRLRGYNCLYICGTDEYGTATETKAMEEGVTPQEICNKYNKIHQDVYKWFNIEFDYFGRTTTEEQTRIAQDIFWKLDKNGYLTQDTIDQLHCQSCSRFLADRFVEGTCPYCAYEDARGDQCDACGKLINAVELKSPRCKVCKAQPAVKSTRHVFLNLPKIESELNSWVSDACEKGLWTNNAKRITKGWLQEGLRPRCITRDLKWGTPVPMEGFTDKVFYVWFDAPIGYLSITANYTDQWEKWWKNPDQVTLAQFMAKDNVPFHTVVFPCSLIGARDNYTLLNDISATEYLNYEDDKFSKSRGIGVFGDNAADTGIPADIYRFYLLYVRPESQDSVFSWNDFVTKNNSELLNNLGNFINRALTFLKNHFNGVLPAMTLTEEDYETVALVNREITDYIECLEKVRIREGIRNILTISRLGNQYIQSNKPWVLIKGNEEERARAGSVLALASNLCALLGQLSAPYMPEVSREIQSQLQYPVEFDIIPEIFVPLLPESHLIGTPVPLFKKIEIATGEELKARFGGGQVKKTTSQKQEKSQAQPEKKNLSPGAGISDLEEAVTNQGDVVRKAKADKAEKAIIDAEVAKLLDLKGQLALAKGEEVNAPKDKKKGKKKK